MQNEMKKPHHKPLRVPIQTYREWEDTPEPEETLTQQPFASLLELDVDGLPPLIDGEIYGRVVTIRRHVTGVYGGTYVARMLGPSGEFSAAHSHRGTALFLLRQKAAEEFST